VDALGNPVRTILTAGHQADITQAEALIAGFAASSVLADKGYDADAFVAIEGVVRISVCEARRDFSTVTAAEGPSRP
jgi:transposase